MKILTLNLNQYGEKHGPWSNRRELIVEAIKKHSPDLVALQAVRQDIHKEGGVNQAVQLASALPEFQSILFQPASAPKEGVVDGQAILSSFPIAEAGFFPLSLTDPVTEDSSARILFYTGFHYKGGEFYLFNAYFSWVDEQNQKNIEEALVHLDAFHEPAVLAGDFNAAPEKNSFKLLKQSGWEDAWAAANPKKPGPTFESDKPTLRIDYVWTNPYLRKKIKKMEIEIVSAEKNQIRMSDHFGLLVHFDW